jgi:hypothetical protein
MTELDLRTDDPEEFQGRVIRLDGAEYEVGPSLGEGGERFVHELINRRFGRATHVILILRDQENAADISAKAREALQQLRDHGLRDHVIHDHVTVHAHGGVFELREGVDRTDTEITMSQLLDAERYDEAESIATKILAAHPDNFLALIVLAQIRGRGDDPYPGLKLALAALRIEPNTRACKVTAMQCAAAAGAFQTFWWQHEDMRVEWPNDHSMDDLAASVHMTMGTPEKATDLKVDQEITELVHQELEAKRRAEEVMRTRFTLEDTPEHNTRNREILEQAYRLYPRAPNIAVNYGLALLRTGDGRAAHDVLSQILPVLDPRHHAEFPRLHGIRSRCRRRLGQGVPTARPHDAHLGRQRHQPCRPPGMAAVVDRTRPGDGVFPNPSTIPVDRPGSGARRPRPGAPRSVGHGSAVRTASVQSLKAQNATEGLHRGCRSSALPTPGLAVRGWWGHVVDLVGTAVSYWVTVTRGRWREGRSTWSFCWCSPRTVR